MSRSISNATMVSKAAKSPQVNSRRRSAQSPLKDKNGVSPPQRLQPRGTPKRQPPSASKPQQQHLRKQSRQKPKRCDGDLEEEKEEVEDAVVVLEPSDQDENDESICVERTTTLKSASKRKRKLSQRDDLHDDAANEDQEMVGKAKKSRRSSGANKTKTQALDGEEEEVNGDGEIGDKPHRKRRSTSSRSTNASPTARGSAEKCDEDVMNHLQRKTKTRLSGASSVRDEEEAELEEEEELEKETRRGRRSKASTLSPRRDAKTGSKGEAKSNKRTPTKAITDSSPPKSQKKKRDSSEDLLISFDAFSVLASIVPRKAGRSDPRTSPDQKDLLSDPADSRVKPCFVVLCPRLDDRELSPCRACRLMREKREYDHAAAMPVSPRKEIVKTKKSILSAIAFDFDNDEEDESGGAGGGDLFDSIVDVEACVAGVQLTEEEQREVEEREKEAERERKRKERERIKAEKEAAKREEIERKKALKEKEKEEKAKKMENGEKKIGGRKSKGRLSDELRSVNENGLIPDNAYQKRYQPFVFLNRDDCRGHSSGSPAKTIDVVKEKGTPARVKKLSNGKLSFEVPKDVLFPTLKKNGEMKQLNRRVRVH